MVTSTNDSRAAVMEILQSAAAAYVVVRLVHLKLATRFKAQLVWLTVFSLGTVVYLLLFGHRAFSLWARIAYDAYFWCAVFVP